MLGPHLYGVSKKNAIYQLVYVLIFLPYNDCIPDSMNRGDNLDVRILPTNLAKPAQLY